MSHSLRKNFIENIEVLGKIEENIKIYLINWHFVVPNILLSALLFLLH